MLVPDKTPMPLILSGNVDRIFPPGPTSEGWPKSSEVGPHDVPSL